VPKGRSSGRSTVSCKGHAGQRVRHPSVADERQVVAGAQHDPHRKVHRPAVLSGVQPEASAVTVAAQHGFAIVIESDRIGRRLQDSLLDTLHDVVEPEAVEGVLLAQLVVGRGDPGVVAQPTLDPGAEAVAVQVHHRDVALLAVGAAEVVELQRFSGRRAVLGLQLAVTGTRVGRSGDGAAQRGHRRTHRGAVADGHRGLAGELAGGDAGQQRKRGVRDAEPLAPVGVGERPQHCGGQPVAVLRVPDDQTQAGHLIGDLPGQVCSPGAGRGAVGMAHHGVATAAADHLAPAGPHCHAQGTVPLVVVQHPSQPAGGHDVVAQPC